MFDKTGTLTREMALTDVVAADGEDEAVVLADRGSVLAEPESPQLPFVLQCHGSAGRLARPNRPALRLSH